MTIEETLKLLNENPLNVENSNAFSHNTVGRKLLKGVLQAPIF